MCSLEVYIKSFRGQKGGSLEPPRTPLAYGPASTHLDFSTKRMLITACSFPTTQRLHSLKFTLVNKSHSQHSVVAVRCEGRHFPILYACAHEVSFPGQIPRSLVWERHLAHKGNQPRARLARSLPVVVGKVCEHYTGKALNSAANL